MNEDRNDVPLAEAPATVDGQKVLGVVQVSISDIPEESGYKVLLANAETAVVPLESFQGGIDFETSPQAGETIVQNPEVGTEPQTAPVAAPAAVDQPVNVQPAYKQPQAPAQPAYDPNNNGGVI